MEKNLRTHSWVRKFICFSIRLRIWSRKLSGETTVTVGPPDYGVIIKNCDTCILKDNTFFGGSMIANIVAENNKDCIIENNIGDIFKEEN